MSPSINNFFRDYFTPSKPINISKNKKVNSIIKGLKIFSYFIVGVPFAVGYALSSLAGRVSKCCSPRAEAAAERARNAGKSAIGDGTQGSAAATSAPGPAAAAGAAAGAAGPAAGAAAGAAGPAATSTVAAAPAPKPKPIHLHFVCSTGAIGWETDPFKKMLTEQLKHPSFQECKVLSWINKPPVLETSAINVVIAVFVSNDTRLNVDAIPTMLRLIETTCPDANPMILAATPLTAVENIVVDNNYPNVLTSYYDGSSNIIWENSTIAFNAIVQAIGNKLLPGEPEAKYKASK